MHPQPVRTGVFAAALRDKLPLLFAAVNLALLAWMLAGLRHTNHDDIYFEIVANDPQLSWPDFTLWAAMLQQRTTHLFNIPISMMGVKIGSSWYSEWVYQAQLLGTGILAFLTLRRLVGETVAAGWLSFTCGTFAIHAYFTAPPGYPVIGLASPGLFLISIYFLLRHFDHPTRTSLAVSVLSSMVAVAWPEYDFIIFTIPIIGLVAWKTSGARRRRLLAVYVTAWLVAAAFYASGKLFFPPGADAGRVTPSFHLLPWGQTFLALWLKAILPFGLADGIILPQQLIPGAPALPAVVSFGTLGRSMMSDPSFVAAFLAWASGFWMVLRRVSAHREPLWALIVMGMVFLVIPLAVVSLSAAYQWMVLAGYIQGHLSSAAAQVGFATVVFAGCAMAAGRWRSNLLRAALSALLAAVCVLSLGYNLLMRDVMAANQQRWQAFHLLAQAVPSGARISAPTFWGRNGVSSIPTNLPPGMSNYWTEWSRIMEGRPLNVRPAGEAPESGDVIAAYAPSPSGSPLVLLKDAQGLALLSRAPRDLRGWPHPDWDCTSICRLRLPEGSSFEDGEKWLWPAYGGPRRLWGRLTLDRSGAFGRMP